MTMLAGSLLETSLPEVLRLLSASSQTGCLLLSLEAPVAFFYFKIGQISHCECYTNSPQGFVRVKGLDAVSKACAYTACTFQFDTRLFSDEETLLKYPTAKLIEGVNQFIEKKKQQALALPKLESVLQYHAKPELSSFKASQEELAFLLLANGKRSLGTIAAQSNSPVHQVLDWAAKFLALGLLSEVRTPVAQEAAPQTVKAVDAQKPEAKPSVRYWRGKPIND